MRSSRRRAGKASARGSAFARSARASSRRARRASPPAWSNKSFPRFRGPGRCGNSTAMELARGRLALRPRHARASARRGGLPVRRERGVPRPSPSTATTCTSGARSTTSGRAGAALRRRPSAEEATLRDDLDRDARPGSVVDGFNGTAFANGQRVGKTLHADPLPDHAWRHHPRVALERSSPALAGGGRPTSSDRRIAYLEIYNDAGFDLLDRASSSASARPAVARPRRAPVRACRASSNGPENGAWVRVAASRRSSARSEEEALTLELRGRHATARCPRRR